MPKTRRASIVVSSELLLQSIGLVGDIQTTSIQIIASSNTIELYLAGDGLRQYELYDDELLIPEGYECKTISIVVDKEHNATRYDT